MGAAPGRPAGAAGPESCPKELIVPQGSQVRTAATTGSRHWMTGAPTGCGVRGRGHPAEPGVGRDGVGSQGRAGCPGTAGWRSPRAEKEHLLYPAASVNGAPREGNRGLTLGLSPARSTALQQPRKRRVPAPHVHLLLTGREPQASAGEGSGSFGNVTHTRMHPAPPETPPGGGGVDLETEGRWEGGAADRPQSCRKTPVENGGLRSGLQAEQETEGLS